MSRSKAYNKEEVLEKAMMVFWKNGYEATSVRLLEKEMAINQFSIYSSFQDKRNLFIESLKKYREHVQISVFAGLLKENAGIKDIERFLTDRTENIKNGSFSLGCLVVNTAAEVGAKDELILKEVNVYFRFIKEMFKKILLNSQKKGEISAEADVEAYANYLLGIMQGLSLGSKVLPRKQLNDFIGMALNNIK